MAYIYPLLYIYNAVSNADNSFFESCSSCHVRQQTLYGCSCSPFAIAVCMDLIFFLSENSRRSMMRGRGYSNSLNLEDNKLTLLILTYISQDHAAVASGRSESAA
jgi:hypothetical protein